MAKTETIKEPKPQLLEKPSKFSNKIVTIWESIDKKDCNTFDVYLPGTIPQTVANFDVFSIIRKPIEIVRIDEVHSTASTHGSPVTLNVERLTGTTVPGAGTSILSADFDLRGTANTIQTKEGYALTSKRILKEGERLALVLTGTPTNLQGLCLTVHYKFAKRGGYN
jgi:hypothetical protein